VVQRTHELGIRLALGAARPRLIRLVLSRALGIVFWGLAFGSVGVWVTTRIISGLLFGVQPLDPPTLFGGGALLILVGVAAAILPSLRGTRLSPVAALKSE
jgi:ABC-type antimicrobial peptide transport system permease subunit